MRKHFPLVLTRAAQVVEMYDCGVATFIAASNLIDAFEFWNVGKNIFIMWYARAITNRRSSLLNSWSGTARLLEAIRITKAGISYWDFYVYVPFTKTSWFEFPATLYTGGLVQCVEPKMVMVQICRKLCRFFFDLWNQNSFEVDTDQRAKIECASA